jgi:glycosyltransferase involved in cell wall biosynthesis
VAVIARLLRKPLVLTVYNWRGRETRTRAVMRDVASRLAKRRTYISDFVWDSWEPVRRPTSAKLPVLSVLPTGSVPSNHRRGFLFIARWVEHKGLEVLIDAYASANIDRERWPLILVGDGPLRPAIEERIRSNRPQGIESKGFVGESTKHHLIRHAKWMVTPPHGNEDLGLMPIEARSVGVPCIVTRDGGVLEAAGNFESPDGSVGDFTGRAGVGRGRRGRALPAR